MRPSLRIPSAARGAVTTLGQVALQSLMLRKARQGQPPLRASSLPTSAPRLRNVRYRDVAMDHMTFVGWPRVRTQLLELHGVC